MFAKVAPGMPPAVSAVGGNAASGGGIGRFVACHDLLLSVLSALAFLLGVAGLHAGPASFVFRGPCFLLLMLCPAWLAVRQKTWRESAGKHALRLRQANEQMRRDRELFDLLFDNSPVAMFIFTSPGDLCWANHAALDMYEFPQEGYRSRPPAAGRWSDFAVDGRQLAPGERPLDTAYREGRAVKGRLLMSRRERDGAVFWRKISAVPSLDGDGKVRAVVCTAMDVTDLMLAQDSLREANRRLFRSNELFSNLLEHGSALVTVVDAGMNIVYINAAQAIELGEPVEALLGSKLGGQGRPPPLNDLWLARSREVLGSGRAMHTRDSYEIRGKAVERDTLLLPVRDAGGAVFAVQIILRDITGWRLVEARIETAAAETRREIGQRLHDSLGQELAGIGLLARALERECGLRQPEDTPLRQQAGRLCDLAKGAIEGLREIVRGLTPVEACPAGLSAALEMMARQTSERFAVVCRFECPEPVEIADISRAEHLYHIAREAVGNAVKHSGCNAIAIRLQREAGEMAVLSVTDNGCGLPAAGSDRGMGIRIMRHRAGQLGGIFDCTSHPGRGTRIACRFAI